MNLEALVEYGAPLKRVEIKTPTPKAHEVLIEVTHCGACHSDVHFHDGYFDVGDGNRLDNRPGRDLPFALGHEIEGIVVACGDTVRDVKIGDRRAVFPWIGCGDCPSCARGDEQLCNARALGVFRNGGFASHCLVPHERYCLNCDGISEGLAATYMCSGITAYSALKHLRPLDNDEPILIIGLGGVGMMALQFAQAMFARSPLVAEPDAKKRARALELGANATYDPSNADSVKQLLADTDGGVAAACDFVGSEKSLGFANSVVRRGGEIKIIGLFGGKFEMAIPFFPFRAISIGGSMTGTLADTKEMLEIVKTGRIAPIPLEMRPRAEASKTLEDLRNGKIVGRVVLTN